MEYYILGELNEKTSKFSASRFYLNQYVDNALYPNGIVTNAIEC